MELYTMDCEPYPDEMFEEAERRETEMMLIGRYNEYYNNECASLPHGMPVSVEHLQSIALRSAIYAFARKYHMKESIPVEDLKNLADLIEKQGDRTVGELAQVHRRKDLDAL